MESNNKEDTTSQKVFSIIFILIAVAGVFYYISTTFNFGGSTYRSSNRDDAETSITELEEKVQNYKTCIEDIRYTVDNALSDIKYPISNNHFSSAIDTIEGVDWCGL